MNFSVPSSTIPLGTLLQFTELTLLVICYHVQLVKSEGQDAVMADR